MGGSLCRIINGWGHLSRARPEAAAISRQAAAGLALPYGLCSFCSPPVATDQSQKRPPRRPQQRTPGWCFACRGHRHKCWQHYKEQARAASGFSRIRWRARAESVYNKISSLQCAREINSAMYGRRRRTGAASKAAHRRWQ